MAVRVRLFAAVRDAAGTAETSVQAGPLPAILDELRARFGEPFTTRLAVCTILVDGDPRPPQATVDVPDGVELAVLPPFSGGAPQVSRTRWAVRSGVAGLPPFSGGAPAPRRAPHRP